MKQILTYIFVLCFSASTIFAQYTPDVLGDNYLYRTIRMPNDYSGKVICTLVKKPQLANIRQAVLYIHGYNDYFFQKELGDSINRHGYNFYALDLRKYGRSILPGQDPFFCKSMKEYFADIDTALAIIKQEGNNKIFLMGHSTGGLLAPYYLQCKKGKLPVDGLILNSPFLDWNMSPCAEKIFIPTISFMGWLFPNLTIRKASKSASCYAQSLLKQYKGEWSFNTKWKMPNGHPIKAGWIYAVTSAQKSLHKGGKINCPILVLSSTRSFPETEIWNEAYLSCDIVLDVHDIQHYGAKLGNHITRYTIQNGIHDLILSKAPYRRQVYYTYFSWLGKIAHSSEARK